MYFRKYPYLPHGWDFFLTPPYPSGNSSKESYISLYFLILQSPPSPRKFQSLLWGEYGYFLALHNREKFSQVKLYDCLPFLTKHSTGLLSKGRSFQAGTLQKTLRQLQIPPPPPPCPSHNAVTFPNQIDLLTTDFPCFRQFCKIWHV